MSIEAMKQALEALEANQPVNYCMNSNGEKFPMFSNDPLRQERNENAITSLRQAIAEAEKQEPVARCRVFPLRGDESIARHYIDWVNGPVAGDLYTHPQPKREPLTELEKAELINKHTVWSATLKRWALKDFALIEAVEAAHGIKGGA